MGSSTTGRAGPANRSPLCSAPGTRARTPPPTTHRGRPRRPGPTARGIPAGAADPHPLRLRGRHGDHRGHPPARPQDPCIGLDSGHRDGRCGSATVPGSPNSPGTCSMAGRRAMRLIVRKERPHPGAQLRIADADGMRSTCFDTNTPDRPTAELELRQRLRACARTGSGPRVRPGFGTCPRTTPPRTRSGWRPSSSRSTCWPR